jgi:recombination protein RecR
MDVIDKLAEVFKEFPGIGERQARRFVYFLMRKNGDYAANFTKLIGELKKEVTQCKECFRFFLNKNHKGAVCDICSDPHTDPHTLLVLEKDSDLESVKKSRSYSGKYFVLGGVVPIVEKDTKKFVRVEELKSRVKKDKDLKEIILAFSLNPHGDHTDHYLRGELKNFGVKISSLGRGLSTGTELEYSDNDTLRNALKNRS